MFNPVKGREGGTVAATAAAVWFTVQSATAQGREERRDERALDWIARADGEDGQRARAEGEEEGERGTGEEREEAAAHIFALNLVS